MAIVDRRANGRNKGSESRKRFIKRHAKALARKVDEFMRKKNLKDLNDSEEIKIKGNINDSDLTPPHRDNSGDDKVYPGNRKHSKGDDILIPKKGSGKGVGDPGDGGLSDDEFEFILSKEEFRNLLFQDMAIPNFLKKSGKGETVESWHNAGFVKYGIPGRLHIKKSYEQALGRTLASPAELKKDEKDNIIVDLDDQDLRYRNRVARQEPIRQAVMFCLMDVSGSMGEFEKNIAKRFFYMVYLFLTTKYKHVRLVFIRYHHEAKEVNEEEFFTGTENGGTNADTAFLLTEAIIKERFDPELDNIYLTMASDGDDFSLESSYSALLRLIPTLNYAAYIKTIASHRAIGFVDLLFQDLLAVFKAVESEYPDKVGMAMANSPEAVYGALQKLFSSTRKPQ